MSKKNKATQLNKKDIDVTSIDPFQYEYTERDKVREKSNYIFSISMRGRVLANYDRFVFQLRQIYDRAVLIINGWTVVGVTYLAKSLDILRVFLYNEYCNIKLRKDTKNMSKSNNNKTDKNIKNNSDQAPKSSKGLDYKAWGRGIIGIMTLFVVVSIAYSAWVIIQGTEDPVHRIMIVPMVIWAAVKLIQQFSKQGDK